MTGRFLHEVHAAGALDVAEVFAAVGHQFGGEELREISDCGFRNADHLLRIADFGMRIGTAEQADQAFAQYLSRSCFLYSFPVG